MALDHYVSRVHLKQFSSPGLGGELMHAIRKSDLEKFPCHRKDVCRIEAGSDNPYLEPPRIIEEFLTCIEPAYDEALENLRSGNLIADTVLAIAGFVSFVITCSPTARRINSPPLKKFIEQESFKLDQSGVLPPPPKELGGVSLTEMLKDGTIKIELDDKYPEAIGITSIVDRTILFGNSDWDILINNHDDSPFFTSDFPVAIEPSDNPSIINRLVCLAPNLAVRIRPSRDPKRRKGGLGFPNFGSQTVIISRHEVCEINQAIVRCAEDLVFFRDDRAWVETFIKKNARFRVDMETKTQLIGGQEVPCFTMKIVR